ncbi:AAA family ATPase [Pseudomonas sp. 18173]|uniref:AAA family ATPase n=1 Tax=Pseudomonas sp. 18173 TaxID=3390055 RepID=UPI003D196D65
MRKIERIGLHNMPWLGHGIEIDVDQGCQFLILTGYNGSGKSRVLSALFETLSLARNHDFPAKESDWVMSIALQDDVEVRAIKADRGTMPHDSVQKKVGSILTKRESLSKTYKDVEKYLQTGKARGSYSSQKSENEDSRNFCAGTIFCDQNELEAIENSINVVAYIDEKIHFNYARKVESALFENDHNLNNTLLVLITEFVSSSIVKDSVSSVLESSVKDAMREYFKTAKKKKLEITEEKAVEYVSEKIKLEEVNLSDTIFSSNDFFVISNEFFTLTKRRLVWNDNTIRLRLCDGTLVDWFLFSKGEKTLLSLFLMVYLYKGSSLFFLDEPETSLHVEWQQRLLPALQKLAPNSQFIIATHSPFLIMNTDVEQVINMAKYTPDA